MNRSSGHARSRQLDIGLRVILLLLVLTLIAPPLWAPSAEAQEPAPGSPALIAVLELDANNIEEPEARAIADRLRYHLGNLGVFQVLERGRMETILREVGFQLSGACDSQECVIQVGQILGVQKMVAGSVSRVGTIYALQVRLVDVASTTIERQAIADVDGIETVFSEGTLRVARTLAGIDEAGRVPETAARPQTQPTAPAEEVEGTRRYVPVRETGWALGIWTAAYEEANHQGITFGKLLGDPRLLYAGWFASIASESSNMRSFEIALQTDLLRSTVLRPYLGFGTSQNPVPGIADETESKAGLTIGCYLHLGRFILRFGTMPADGSGGQIGFIYDLSPSRRDGG
jgi:hypothetical protein